MAATIYASPQLQTLIGLECHLRKSWKLEINFFDHCAKYHGLMPDRLKAVIRNKGHSVLY